MPNPKHEGGPKSEGAPEGDRIAKVLSRSGVASRREAERMIQLGQVAVNGKVIDSPALNVTPRDRITVNGEPLAAPEPARLWLYYKPEGLVTSASDEKGRDTVFDHLPEDMPRVMSVGRLDLNSEGLLLLTNDGELKRQLELPSTGWLRKYRVRVNGNPTDPDLDPLRKGITVDGERFQPMEVKLDRVQGANAWLTVGLREGRNREIRRAMNAIDLYVNRLIRVSYGPFRLNELEPGEVQEVRPKILRDQLGTILGDQPAPEAPQGRTGARPGGGAERSSGKPTLRVRTTSSSSGSRSSDAKPAAPRSAATRTAKPADAAIKPMQRVRPARLQGMDDTDPTKSPRTYAPRKAGAAKPYGDKPFGAKADGSKADGSKPYGAKPAGSKPAGGKPAGAKPFAKPAAARPAASRNSPKPSSGAPRKPRG